MKYKLFACVLVSLTFNTIKAVLPQKIENNRWRVEIDENNSIKALSIFRNDRWDTISFRNDRWAGPRWYFIPPEKNIPIDDVSASKYAQLPAGIEHAIDYQLEGSRLKLTATLRNHSKDPFHPARAGLIFGLNNSMDTWPEWNNIYFPTLLRCESTHFWGYLMNPNGHILGIGSPNPIASWSLNYNTGYGSSVPNAPFWGHRIYTFNLDLLCSGKLPSRHPQALNSLKPGEEYSWVIYLEDISSLTDVPIILSKMCKARFIELERTTLEPSGNHRSSIDTLNVVESNGYHSQGMVYTRHPWSWYLQRARHAALKYTQKASWNCESWYGFYSAYLAQIYFPDQELLRQTNDRFNIVIPLMYDTLTMNPTQNPNRIQNHSTTLGIYVDRYRATGNVQDLEKAAQLADWIIKNAQVEDGSFRSHKTHYTSVIYPAKSIMELYFQEKMRKEPEWQERYQRHYASVKRAIDQLMLGIGKMDTEGQLTFEDGMVSCSALQIAAFALQQNDSIERKRYTDQALELLHNHDCLTQLAVPDGRMRGGTLRFWEAQYDVQMGHNMLNSPHGWTSWRTYATWYAYLLTGDEQWLIQTLNALGSCMQVISEDGVLRWAFVPEPQVHTVQTAPDYVFPKSGFNIYNDNQYKAEEGIVVPVTVGEQYVPMISDWFSANSSDNDVHEHFKCLEEVALTAAYVVERSDGTLQAYNCQAKKIKNTVVITPSEKIVSKVHLNLRTPTNVSIKWTGNMQKKYKANSGLQWIQNIF